jgi:hypothetical protein
VFGVVRIWPNYNGWTPGGDAQFYININNSQYHLIQGLKENDESPKYNFPFTVALQSISTISIECGLLTQPSGTTLSADIYWQFQWIQL